MATVDSQPAPPELKSIDRLASIPLVHDSISAIQSAFKTYTPTAYSYGSAIGSQAYSFATPIQVHLAPFIASADGYALKGIDIAQARFPTPFSINAEEIVTGIRERKDSALNAVTKPVYYLATGVDSSLAPIVDRIEVAVHRLAPANQPATTAGETTEGSPTTETQVGRLYNLSLGLRDHIYVMSAEQLKQLQSQGSYIQTASDKVAQLNGNLTATYSSAKDKSLELVQETQAQVHLYGNNILAELERVQQITKDLPKNVQARLQPMQEGIQKSLSELGDIVKSDLPVGEKVSRVGVSVQDKVQPLLAQTTQTIQAYINEARVYVGGSKANNNESAP